MQPDSYPENAPDGQDDAILTFRAGSLREALASVRAALGPDALIVSQTQHGAEFVVEATNDHGEAVLAAALQSARRSTAAAHTESAAQATSDPDPMMVIQEAAPGAETGAEPIDLLPQTFNYAGVEARQLAGCFRFVGASGVGKTTTLLKVLAEWVMHNGKDGVVVISTDDQKLAGAEPLQLACQMLRVEMHVCPAADLAPLISRLRYNALVLIDTPAQTLPDTSDPAVAAAPVAVRDVLVCSAQHSRVALMAQAAQLRERPHSWIVLTHTDQAFDADAIVSWLSDTALTLAWLGASDAAADNLENATPASLGTYLVRQHRALEQQPRQRNHSGIEVDV